MLTSTNAHAPTHSVRVTRALVRLWWQNEVYTVITIFPIRYECILVTV